ncbi:Aste57867_25355 [Aphanomyces stellatus]|uniref:Aste57867_25355 protein n=1 Tax=Aphanomyces stellatus TaxID=120398 RepID=A0A485LUA5_9STRA|nr:hypothetical protein As57867_025277 [Aphanomyces stellatus]VFU01980.1 Aste57867_25355 [Aphanomyces stellatus]
MNSVHMVNNQRFSLEVGASLRSSQATSVKWPWCYDEPDLAVLSDDHLCHRAVSFADFMASSIQELNEEQYLQRIESGKCDHVRSKTDPKLFVHTVHATALFHASLPEVLAIFNDEGLFTHAFRTSLVSNTDVRRVVPSTRKKTVAPTGRHTAALARSQSSSSGSEMSTTTTHNIVSFGIKKAIFQDGRGRPFAKTTQRELLYLDYLEHKSDTTITRTLKSIDTLHEYPTFKKGDLPLERHEHVLLGYHVEAVGPTRVRVSFGGHYCYQHGLLEVTRRLLTKFADVVDLLPRLVFQSRLATCLFARPQKQHTKEPGYACRLCARTFSAFMKQRLCRLCSQDVCSSCSTIEQVPTSNDLVVEARICLTCVDALKQGELQDLVPATVHLEAPTNATSSLDNHTSMSFVRSASSTAAYQPSIHTRTPARSTPQLLPRSASAPTMKPKAAATTPTPEAVASTPSARRQSIVQDTRNGCLFDVACMTTARRMGCAAATVTLLDEAGKLVTKSMHGAPAHALYVREAMHMTVACVVDDANADARFAGTPAAASTRFFYGLPLAAPDDGLLLGVVSVSDAAPRPSTTDVDCYDDQDAIMHEFQQTILKLLLPKRAPLTIAQNERRA